MDKLIKIYIMGKEYEVPEGLTIMKAMEYSGYRFVRGCGCRGGTCGACPTVYRTRESYNIKVGLACQTQVEEGMYLTQIPFYPANKSSYNLDNMDYSVSEVLKNYPEIARCLSCNTCVKICPQDLEVMEAVQAALRGDIKKAATLSFECVMCGLCASRCPAELVQYHIFMLCRRLYGKYGLKKARHLQDRIKEIEEKKFEEEMNKIVNSDDKDLIKMYDDRDIEPV